MRSITVAFLLATIAPVAIAQPSIVRPGAHVRIDAPGVTTSQIEATILSMTPDTIVIGNDKLAPLSVPRAAIRNLEFGSGKDHWRGTVKGTVIGTEWGAGLGALVAATIDSQCEGGGYGSTTPRTCHSASNGYRLEAFAACAYVGAFYGAIIGAIVGSEKWDKVELPTHGNIGLQNGRPALSWSLSF